MQRIIGRKHEKTRSNYKEIKKFSDNKTLKARLTGRAGA